MEHRLEIVSEEAGAWKQLGGLCSYTYKRVMREQKLLQPEVEIIPECHHFRMA